MWAPELLLPPKTIRIIGPKTDIFAPKCAFFGDARLIIGRFYSDLIKIRVLSNGPTGPTNLFLPKTFWHTEHMINK